MSDDYPRVQVSSRAELRAWLVEHHASSRGIWLVTYKKHAGPERYVAYDAIVEEALCFGWIDAKQRRVDEDRSELLYTPRKPTSKWSRSNKDRVRRLEADGLLAPAGIAVIEAARKSGTWTALDAVENLEEPDALRAALDAEPDARRQWDAFPRSARRAILEWIANAKREETRARRIALTVSEASAGRRANEWRPPSGR